MTDANPITDEELAEFEEFQTAPDCEAAEVLPRMIARIKADAEEIKRLRNSSGIDPEMFATVCAERDQFDLWNRESRAKLRVAEEALEFYADRESYRNGSQSLACCEWGDSAREALAKIRKGKT